MLMRMAIAVAIAATLTLSASAARAGPTVAQRCEAAKLKIAGKYTFCRLKAEAKAAKTGDPPDYSRCDPKFSDKWASAESAAGTMCPTNGDQAAQQAELTGDANRTAWRLSGQPRFLDNADGTISDRMTGLMWEKKTELDGGPNFANLHEADNYYPWAGTCSISANLCQPTTAASSLCSANAEGGTNGCAECGLGEGTCSPTDTVWTWAVALNTASFAGHTDWRVAKLAELVGIVDYADGTPPAVDAAFQGMGCGTVCTDITDPACSCTVVVGTVSGYWSASAYAPDPNSEWVVRFDDGYLFGGALPAIGYYVRAVRGSS